MMAERALENRYGLLQKGLFPETLPPCFTSVGLKRSFSGLVRMLHERAYFAKRQSNYILYNGTKHDGSRRYYGTPNPISYFYVADFIAERWSDFDSRFSSSPFSVSRPRVARNSDDRAIIMQSLSELATIASKKLSHSEYILKTDVAQFFPSIYTHAISWSAHGIESAKNDTRDKSSENYFNRLDFFVRNCQANESRGLLIGPDAFRLIAEYIMAGIDKELKNAFAENVVGVARHVDDYYVGLIDDPQAKESLAVLRDILQRYNLNVNDAKTRVMTGVEPLNEVWAQDLRRDKRQISFGLSFRKLDDIVLFINKSLHLAEQMKSASPVKIALRALDELKIYSLSDWGIIEPYLQRIIFHYPHAIDYTALLVVKRVARNGSIDREGWKTASYTLLSRHLALKHHHEIVWLLWLLFTAKIEVSEHLVQSCAQVGNAHVLAMLVAGFHNNIIQRRPPINLGSKLSSTGSDWLLNIVSKVQGFSRAPFTGALTEEFEHLAMKKMQFIDFTTHLKQVKIERTSAISRTRYGYDSESGDANGGYDEDGDDFMLDSDDLDAEFLERIGRENT